MVIVLTSCWDNRDLTEMGITTAIGLDRIENGNIELTVQGVKPDVIKARAKGGGKKAYWVYSATGKTAFSAIRNILTKLDRKVFFAHVNLIVIGEELAREGIMEALDLFERDHETNRKANVIIAKGGKAKKVLKAESEVADIPAMHIVDILKNNFALAKIKQLKLIDLLQDISNSGFSPSVGVIKITKKINGNLQIKDLEVKGTAIFKKDKLIGWLDSIETRGLLFAQDEVQSGIITTANPLQKDKDIAFEITNSSGELDAKLKSGKLKLMIKVKAKGRFGDQQGRGNLATPEMVKKLEKNVGNVIEKNIRKTVNLAQKDFEHDFFGFAKIVHKKYPDYWEEIENNWSRVFSNAPVEIKAVWKTKSSALIKRRLKPQ